MGAGGTALPDASSDVAISTGLFGTNRYRLDGVINIPATGGGWTWTNVRDVNYFLENVERVQSGLLKDQYIGESYSSGHGFILNCSNNLATCLL